MNFKWETELFTYCIVLKCKDLDYGIVVVAIIEWWGRSAGPLFHCNVGQARNTQFKKEKKNKYYSNMIEFLKLNKLYWFKRLLRMTD